MASSTASRFVPEEDILMPTTETINDNWPMYVLNDAVVYRPDGKTIAHALLVNIDGPFTIRGRLEIEDGDEEVQYLIDPTIRSIDVEIKDSKLYSIGYDPSAALWLSGKAGWFEINPHTSYAKIHAEICEVSQLDYIMANIYLEDDGSLKDARLDPSLADIREVLLRYAMALGDGLTYDETVDKVLRLGPAYVSHLECAAAGGTPWKQTSIYSWLVRELKNKERSRRSSSRGTSQPPLPDAAPASASAAAAIAAHIPAAAQQAPRPLSQTLAFRGSPAANLPDFDYASNPGLPDPHGTGPVTPAEEEAVFQLFLRIVLAIGEIQGPPSTVTPGKVHANMNKSYRLSKYNTGKELSGYFHKRLLQSLGPAWDSSLYRQYLSGNEHREWTLPSSAALRSVPGQLVRRNVGQPRAHTLASRASSQSLSQASTPPPGRPQSTPKTGGKSAGLRPHAAAKKRPYGGAFEAGYDSDDIPDYAPTQPAQHVPRPIGRPRKYPKFEAPAPAPAPQAQPVQQDDSSDTDQSSDDSDDDDIHDSETVVAVHSVPLNVSTRPTGPNGTWNCPHPKCRFFAKNGTSEAAQTSIKEHLREHEEKTLNRVDLAISEGSRKHVSVDNLLAKIRALADAKAEKGQPDEKPRTNSSAVGTSSSSLRRYLF